MKKLINNIILLIGIIIISSSCKKFLQEEPIDVIPADYVYTTAEGLNAGVTALYNLQRTNNFPTGFQLDGNLEANFFFYVGDDLGLCRTWSDPYGTIMNPVSFYAGKWTLPYQIIDRCNSIIKYSADINMDQVKKDKLVAQARVIRAELYLDLYTMYDNIVLKTEPSTVDNIDQTDYSPAAPADIFKVIDNDLDFAIGKLDWVVASGQYGQGVARHIKGKSAMWQGKWQEAANQFDAIVANGTHHLVALNAVFTGDRNNAESLFTYQFNQALGGTNLLAGGGPNYFPSLFNCRIYELSSGEMIPDVSNGGMAYGWAYPNDYLQSLYDKVNDKRYVTYYYPTKYIVNNPAKPNFGMPLPDASYEDNYRRYHWSLKKYHDVNKPATSYDSYSNYIYYRFAETLLLGAEAHWRLSGNNTDPKALEYLNLIRQRAFGDSSHNFTAFTLNDYLDEYAREMALEKVRWFLLKRLGLLFERVNLHYMYGGSSTNVKLKTMKDYMVRLPIPQSQINLMKTFPQNPGY